MRPSTATNLRQSDVLWIFYLRGQYSLLSKGIMGLGLGDEKVVSPYKYFWEAVPDRGEQAHLDHLKE